MLFFRFALEIFVRQLHILDKFLMGLHPVSRHTQSTAACFGLFDFVCDYFVLQGPLVFGVDFDDPVHCGQEHPRGFKVITIVVAQQSDFVIELRPTVVPFHELLACPEMNAIFQPDPSLVVVLLHELVDFGGQCGVVRVGGVEGEACGRGFKIS